MSRAGAGFIISQKIVVWDKVEYFNYDKTISDKA